MTKHEQDAQTETTATSTTAPDVGDSAETSDLRLPLTPAQRGIWYAQQLDPGNATYQIGQYLDVEGPVDPRLLSIALTKTVRDIDSISMRFRSDDDGPHAVMRRPEPTDDLLEVVDLRSEDVDTAVEKARALMDAEMATPRDITGDELFGAILFRLAGDRSLFFQRVHHITLDGYSAVIALHYLARVYTELDKRAPTGLLLRPLAGRVARTAAKTPSPFPGHLELLDALEEYRTSEEFAEDEAFWRETFEEETTVDGLEGTTGRAATRVVRVAVPLTETQAAALAALGRDLPKTMVGIIAVYLAKITGQETVSLGLPVTARRGKVAKSTPSMLSSILPVRVDVSASATVAETIQHAGFVLRGVVKHQRFRTEDLPTAPSQAGPSVNLLPVIDALAFGSARGEVRILSTGPVHDLSFVVSGLESDAAVPTVQLEGDAALHTVESLTEHADRLLALVDQVVAQPDDLAVTSARVVADDEVAGLLQQGAGPELPIEAETVLEAFAAAASQRGDDVAVVAPDGQLTFAELDAESTRMAHHLLAQGVETGRCVAVRIERSKHLPLLVLAVLKAGGVYVPLDPEYPIDRVAGMIEDSEPVLLLTSHRQAERDRAAGARWTVPSVAVDSDTAGSWRRCSDDASTLPTLHGTDLAYVVFTSGSTGRPKGVGVERVALRNLFQHHRTELFDPAAERLGRPVRVAHTAGLSFDAAWDPLLWLFAGHELHMIDDDVRRDPQRLADHLSDAGIDSIETTPSFAEALLAAGLFDRDPHPTVVALGGEEVGPSLWDALGALDDVHAVNFYGPTEVTVDSLVATITAGDPHIGTSVRNSRHYILDASLSPVPDRAVGELYLAGVNVARGYVGQPGLSAERFVADPFASDGSRMYRTGDVVRRRHDGSLRFLGRIDDQVKIRGYRVELTEIEAAMRRQDGVVGAAAIVQGEGPAARLVGYVTGEGDGAADGGADERLGTRVRDALRADLPDYMVPSAVMTLADLPLTPNGKLDRRALPTPGRSADDSAQQPRTAVQRTVATAFAEVLGVESVGIEEDFFAAGGHSLLATRLASALTQALDVTVTVRDVFEKPTVAQLAGLTASGDDEELAADGTAPRRAARLAPAARPDRLPVSLAQRRLWFLNRLEPASAAYNIPVVLNLAGRLDVAALRAAFGDVVARHEPLRTVFPYMDGEPVQVVLDGDDSTVPFTSVDVPASQVDAVIEQEALRPFDVTEQTPLRAVLLRTAPDTHVLVATMHHIASDGWSLAPFARDLSVAYAARAAGHAPEQSDLPVTYADFTLWQREHLGDPDDESSVLAEQLTYWNRALAGAPDEISLPRDRSRGAADPSDPEQNGVGEVALELDPQRHAAVRALAAEHRTSVFIVLHTALAVALEQQGAGEDVVLGTPVAGRADPQLDELVGFFVTTVVLRTSLAQDPTLAEVLGRVRAGNTEAYAHQDVPFDSLVDALRPPRVADRHPLFQVLLTLQSNEPAELDLDGLAVTVPGQVTSAGVKADLLVDFQTPTGDDGPLVGALGYDRALFDRATAERLRDALDRVLTAIVDSTDSRLSDLPSVDAETAERLAEQSTGRELAAGGTVLDRLAETVAAHGTEPALVDTHGSLDFASLDVRVDAAARGLLSLGVTRGDRVAVALPRTSDAVVLVLAALRAGAVAVPVDVAYPDARVVQILTDSDSRVLVTDDADRASTLVGLLGEDGDVEDEDQLVVRTAQDVVDAGSPSDGTATVSLPAAPAPRDVAYLVYTSGTTGTPKGVQVPHSALANVLAQHEDTLVGPLRERLAGLSSASETTSATSTPRLPRMLHLSGLGFDAAWDPILWLVSGTTLHMADDATRTDAEAVVRAVVEHGIDVLETTPSYAQQLVTVGLLDGAADREVPLLVAVGGEAVPTALWDRLAAAPGVDGWNLYGPSEFTVDSVLAPVEAGRVTIGAPIANVTARVLDSTLRPVPPGVEGELYLSGPSEAHGYLGRSAETASRFVADPSGDGTRMYRTGDVVRRRLSGELEFVRRDDDQVKLRGYRIEVEDVERTLERADGVRTAVARVVTPGGPDTARLVAWVVGSAAGTTGTALAPSALDTSAVRAFAAAELPDYMVPTSITPIDAVPLTPNGKVDVAALPEPGDRGPSRAPETDDERALCAIVGDVLGVRDVGLDDDFFALGGHSLLAVALAGRVRDELGATLPLRAVFDAPTPAALLALLGRGSSGAGAGADAAGAGAAGTSVAASDPAPGLRAWVAANPRQDGEELPLTSGQARLWFLNRLDPSSAEYSVVLQVELSGDLDVAALSGAVDDLVDRHEVLRTTYPEVDGRPVQRVHPSPTGLMGDEPVDTSVGFDLTVDQPVRAALVATGDHRWRLDLVIHHVATDGASLAPLVRDLSASYTARRSGSAKLQRPLEVQYADVARREHVGADSDATSQHLLDAWVEGLAGAPAELDLPADGRRPETAAQPAGLLEFEIPADVARRVSAAAARQSASGFHGWLGGLAGYLHRIGAGDDVVIGSPSAGRTDADVADLVGFFVNTLPLRIDLTDGAPSLADAIERARSATLQALEGESVPFERIVEALAPERRLGRHPVFQTMLSVEEPTGISLDLEGVKARPVAPGTTGSAKVDLSFTLRPRGAGAGAGTRGADGAGAAGTRGESPTSGSDTSGTVDGVLEYNAAMFSVHAARGLVDRWVDFLREAADAPDEPLVDTVLSQSTLAPLDAWPSVCEPRPVLDVFAESVRRFGEQVALVGPGEAYAAESLDFIDLDARVSALAAGLTAHGVGAGDVVALRLPRSTDTIAALLAVWRAGGVVAPVDDELPAERVASMLRSAAPRLVVHVPEAQGEPEGQSEHEPQGTHQGQSEGHVSDLTHSTDLTHRAAEEAGLDRSQVVALADLLTRAGSSDSSDVVPAPAASTTNPSLDDPAYLIFTSGTTGEPKAVQVPHAALASLLVSHRATLMPDPAVRRAVMAHTTGVGFDAAMDPVLWLVAGHELHVVGDEVRRDPEALVELFEQREISAWETTPSYVAALAGQTSLTTLLNARSPEAPFTMLLGGEALDAGLWDWLRERPAVEAWNLYGPTEVGVDSLVARVSEAPSPELGATTPHTIGYVLDSRLRPALPGSVGELWLAGSQLAHGYAGRGGATAERFVADPFAADGSRMYRTGDLVVVRDSVDGRRPSVVTLGRSDGQVKIRGHRVEPGEVEALLRAADGVSQAVVRPVETARGVSLGAWVVLAAQTAGGGLEHTAGRPSAEPAGEAPDHTVEHGADHLTADLMADLRSRVPDYMVPAAVRVVDEIPLTPNGKVDVRALPELETVGAGGRAPAPGAESAVAAAFAKVLGVSDVGADDSFFELGGHSFVAQPAITAVNTALGSSLPVQALFQAPTVAGLAALAGSGTADVADSLRTILPLRPEGTGAPLFAVHPASGVSWKYSVLLGRLSTRRPVLGLQMPGIAPDEPETATAETLDDLLDEYVAAMRTVQPEGPYHLLGWSFGGRLAQHLAARLQAQGDEVALVALLDAYPTEESALEGVAGGDAMWRGFLDANGITAPDDVELDVRTVLAMLGEAGNPLGDVPVESIERSVRRFVRMGELFDTTPVPELEGDLHVFEATEEVPAGRPEPSAWEKHVRGSVTSSTVAVRHSDMLSDEAMDDVAPVLDELLRGVEQE
ncbi:amino acid adenylation enzyme/thioester reductase family protein [Sanguibacter keddieii DSM 10542]|uniref:Amino acid adenylation enzyme/thioester reductase family protein n=1 Tax=Sanguibacter keddieii (strain ATCC 51767 / DSM 10542 / NCFB 3025 / ST-74) TaxID=446469 RepID=D1BHC4_SANKS|nr:non-ribosomal peptide synthetase [Sanguibacter keddieii]ACZ21844.1 amino acid adenylation enzyme/thioester reductase family protein [Sanguibacter keddieii DSM 10542]